MDEAQTREEAERNSLELLADFKAQFERGDPVGVVQAIRLCIMWGLPIPEWAAGHAEAAIIFYFQNGGGAPGRGRTGNLKTQWRRYRKHLLQAQIAEHEIARGGSKTAALHRAVKRLPRVARVEAQELARRRKSVARRLRRAPPRP